MSQPPTDQARNVVVSRRAVMGKTRPLTRHPRTRRKGASRDRATTRLTASCPPGHEDRKCHVGSTYAPASPGGTPDSDPPATGERGNRARSRRPPVDGRCLPVWPACWPVCCRPSSETGELGLSGRLPARGGRVRSRASRGPADRKDHDRTPDGAGRIRRRRQACAKPDQAPRPVSVEALPTNTGRHGHRPQPRPYEA